MTELVPLESNAREDEPAQSVAWSGIWQTTQGACRRLRNAASDRQVMLGLMVAILLLGGILRFTGLGWGEHQHLHPDERFLTMVENSLQWPKSLKEYFDTPANPLNPHNHGHSTYVYGLFPVVMAKFLGQVTGNTGYDGVYLVGRAMNGALDMLCIVLVFLAGRRLYDARVGLLGALLLSLSVLNVQQSHYFTVDSSTAFYVTLALYFAVRVAQGEGWGSVLMLGVAFGAAASAKISVVSFLLIIGLAYLLRTLGRWKRGDRDTADALVDLRGRLGRLRLSLRIRSDERCGPASDWEHLLVEGVRAALSVAVVMLVALVVFRVLQPQAFMGPGFLGLKINPKWKSNMDYARKLVSGEIDYPPSHQWTAREPVWFMLKNMVCWGLGLPLGVTVWVSWALMAWELYRKHRWAHLLPWVWMTFTFFYQSIQFVKTTRYLLPIYPTMAVVAAYGLIRLWDWAKGMAASDSRRWLGRWVRPLTTALILIVVLGTAFWAIAFTTIYTRPVSRATASRWIYRNIPPGSTLSFEMWDDAVPLNIDGHIGGAEFSHVKMEPYWEDVPEKRERLYSWLEETDYIALTSNRLYGSIPRMPMRFPMTTRYYEALFSGELGFDHLMTFTSRPKLFGIEIVDDDAEESFTVYDHPKVILFKKRPDFSTERVRELFEDFELERIVRVKPLQVTTAPNNLMLRDGDWVMQRYGGTWSTIFERGSLSNRLPTLIWLASLFFVGLVAFPLGFVAFRRMRDRGYVLSKTMGLLLLAYISWLLPSLRLVPYTRVTIAAVLASLTLVSAAVAWTQRRALAVFLSARWRLLLMNEALFLCFFAVFWLIRHANPDLWHPGMGGEKPMDLAYLNAIIKSTYFPPYDPWFAGGYINYYYFGWVVVATMIKLTAIVPWVAYNLAIPTLFAMVAMGASCVAFNLIRAEGDEDGWFPRALRYGLVGACLVAVVGNLGEVQLLLKGLQELGKTVQLKSTIPGLVPLAKTAAGLWALLAKGQSLPFRPEWWYWNASRIMTHGEINEFPFFTFLYADLHAHLTAMPFALLALALSASFLVTPIAKLSRLARDWVESDEAGIPGGRGGVWRSLRSRWRRVDWALGLRLVLLGLTVGELWCNNSWDFPTYLGIALVALAIGLYADERKVNQRTITQLALRAGCVLVLSMLLYRPYHANFGLAYASVEPWKGERTPISAYLIIHVTSLFILVSYLLTLAFERGTRSALARAVRLFARAGARRQRARHLYSLLVRCQSMGYELGWLGLAILGFVLLALLSAKAWVLLLTIPILVLAGLLTLYRRASPERRFQTLLVFLGVALTVGVDYVVIKGDIGRMNTVFKFYLQVWIMWGIVAAVALARLSRQQRIWPGAVGQVWRTVLALLLVCVSLYPILATYGKVRDRWIRDLPGGLDGMRYMAVATYQDNNRNMSLENDHRAITWMQDHIQGSPVVAEANAPLYRWGSRVSIYTGLPTIIGWDWHQKQQRASVSGDVVDWRLQDLRELYNTQDRGVATEILSRYHVGYVLVGELEQAYYDAQGLAKFDEMVGSTLDVAYRQGPVTIYRVRYSGAREVAQPATSREARWPPWDWLAKQWIPGVVRAEGPEKHPSGDLSEGIKGPTLMLDVPVDRLPVLRDRGWNPLARDRTIVTVAFWWLVMELIGLAAWPVVSRVFGRFNDGGYALSKGIGLLLVSYLVWISSSLRVVANNPLAAWLSLAVLGSCSFFLWRRRRHDLRDRWRRHRRLMVVEEGVFCLAFLVFVGLRIMNPDLWHPWFGGEKMMEIAFLNALTKSAYMPPYDPYFSGGYINYYYYGQFLVAVLIKLTGVTPEVGFNLAIPTFFSLTVSHAFGLGYQLAGARDGPRSRPRFEPTGLSLFRAPESRGTICQGTQGALAAGSGGASCVSQRELSPVPLCTSGVWGGVGAATLVAVVGNLSGVVQLVEGVARAGGATFAAMLPTWADMSRVLPGFVALVSGRAQLLPFEYWYRATRVIPNTINEFPFFSFLFADLHPHMIGIPFTLLAMSICLALALDDRPGLGGAVLRLAVAAIVMGAIGVINTWDLPTYWGILGCAMLYRGCKLGGTRGLPVAAATFMAVVLVSLIAYGPFYAHFRAQYFGLGLVPQFERTHLAPFLVIWGFFLFLTASLLVLWIAESWPWSRMVAVAQRFGWRRTLRRLWQLRPMGVVAWAASLTALAGAGVILVLGTTRGMLVLALCVPLLAAAGVVLPWSGKDEARFIRRLMAFVAVGILVGVEIVYMRDFLEGCEWLRMNTVFKFYIQAWVLLGVVAGSALPKLWQRARRSRGLGVIWRTAFVVLLASSLVYTVFAVPVRVNDRFPSASPRRPTLDGTAYMKTAIYAWPDRDHLVELEYDHEAVEWLWKHVEGTPVLAEAPLPYYREGGLRVSSSTGLPTLVGAHEREQRPWEQVEPRERDAEAIYTTTDLGELFTILERYRVRYIYVGQLEHYAYGDLGLAKFDDLVRGGMLARAFHNERVDIYRVLRDWGA